MPLTITEFSPEEITAALDELAALRTVVFRSFPYLYDGDRDYEARYLATYASSPGAVVIGARDGERLVGAATGTPMEDHEDEFAAPLAAHGYDVRDVFYCAESVLLPAWRGQGTGHAFFDLREAAARRMGRRVSCFCAVIRPHDHPARPADYQPLDPFWRRRGYRPLDGAIAEFSWKDMREAAETKKPMQVWIRDL